MKSIVKTLFFYFALTVIASSLSLGQDSFERLKEIIPPAPPSPNARSLGMYGAWPVSYYRGLPDISIPLTVFRLFDYELPVTLSYHASGIKPDEIASWVGLGWSLNAGGVISVSVKGKSDFDQTDMEGNSAPRARIRSKQDIANKDFFNTENEYNQIIAGSLDAESDIYNYSFGTYSGQFVLDNNLNVHFLKNNGGVTIEVRVRDKSIIARDQYGRSYIFNQLEYTTSKPLAKSYDAKHNTSFDTNFFVDEVTHISAFYLSEIVLENNKGSILFEYENEVSEYYTSLNGTMSTSSSYGDNPCGPFFPSSTNPLYWREQSQHAFIYQKVKNASKRLKRIYSDRGVGEISFTTDLQRRLDIGGTKALKSISVFSPRSSNPNIIWEFDYNYFSSPVGKTDGFNNQLHKRLRLSGLLKKSGMGSSSLAEAPYTFGYYGDNEPDLCLPYRTSFDGSDFWGFCNADARGISPSDYSKIFSSVQSGDVDQFRFVSTHAMYYKQSPAIMLMYANVPMPAFNGGNKVPNGYFGKAFTLRCIEYPTGGRTEFEYEGHQYSAINNSSCGENPCGGIRIKSIKDIFSSSRTLERSFSYSVGVISVKPRVARANPKACNNPSATGQQTDCFMGIVVGPSYDETWSFFTDTQAYLHGYILSSTPIDPIYSYNSDYIGYRAVTETNSDGGKSMYYYNTANDTISTNNYSYQCGFHTFSFEGDRKLTGWVYSTTPVYPFTDHTTGPIYKRGLLRKKQVFSSINKLVYKEELDYDHIEGTTVYGNRVFKTTPCRDHFYYLTAYEIHTGKSFLSNRKITTYDVNGLNPVTEEHNYEYYTDKELLKRTATTNSNGQVVSTHQTYPFCYPDLTFDESNGNRTPIHSALVGMKRKGMDAYPVETLISVNNGWKNGKLILYNGTSGNYLPMSSYEYIAGVPQMGGMAFDGRHENPTYFYKTISYDSYDTYGNLLQVHKVDDQNTSYVWGYDKVYPIAKIVNAQQSEVAYSSFEGFTPFSGRNFNDGQWSCAHAALRDTHSYSGRNSLENQGSTIRTTKVMPAGTYRISLWAKNLPGQSGGAITIQGQSGEPMWPGSEWRFNERTITLSSAQKVVLNTLGLTVLIDELRLYPMDAQMTTYTHDPLIGITSITDSNNRTTYYEYDGLGRLTLVRDQDGNILEQHEYSYREVVLPKEGEIRRAEELNPATTPKTE